MNFVFLTVLFLLISNCTSKDKINDSRNNAITILSVNPELEETIDFTSIFDAISYIPLETTESNLIGLVNQVIFSQEKYYLMDEFSIHAFSKIGSHKFSINNYGRYNTPQNLDHWLS